MKSKVSFITLINLEKDLRVLINIALIKLTSDGNYVLDTLSKLDTSAIEIFKSAERLLRKTD